MRLKTGPVLLGTFGVLFALLMAVIQHSIITASQERDELRKDFVTLRKDQEALADRLELLVRPVYPPVDPNNPPAVQRFSPTYVNLLDAIAFNNGWAWDKMAGCETASNWQMMGSSFSGGVGFANSTWSAYRWPQMPANAGLASREEQIVVAERVLWNAADGKYSKAWGCAEKVGLS